MGLPSSLTLKRVAAKRGFKLTGQLKIAGVDPKGVKLDLYAGKKAGPAPNAVSGGTGKRIASSAKLPSSGKYTLARPNVKFATFFQTRFENYTTPCSGPVALRPPGSVSPRAHRRGDEQPGQGPEAEAQEEEALVRLRERGLPPEAPLSALQAGRRGATTRATSPGSCARRSRRP